MKRKQYIFTETGERRFPKNGEYFFTPYWGGEIRKCDSENQSYEFLILTREVREVDDGLPDVTCSTGFQLSGLPAGGIFKQTNGNKQLNDILEWLYTGEGMIQDHIQWRKDLIKKLKEVLNVND